MAGGKLNIEQIHQKTGTILTIAEALAPLLKPEARKQVKKVVKMGKAIHKTVGDQINDKKTGTEDPGYYTEYEEIK